LEGWPQGALEVLRRRIHRPVFNCTLIVSTGGAGGNVVKLHARQRPTLLRRPGVCPLLLTGASTDPVSQYYSSFTLAQSVDCS
jgi:hypothetical protein